MKARILAEAFWGATLFAAIFAMVYAIGSVMGAI